MPMSNDVLLIIGLIIAFVNLYSSILEIIKFKDQNKYLNKKSIAFIISLAIVSIVYIFIGIKSIGLSALIISVSVGFILLLISTTIFSDSNTTLPREK